MTKRKTARAVARGYSKALRERGVTLDKRGRARDAAGHFVSTASLQRRVARLRRAEREVIPTAPAHPPPRLVFEQGPAAVQGPAYRAEKKRLRKILGYEPSAAQMTRAIKAIQPKRKPPTYDEVMEHLSNRGVLDHDRFRKVSERFGVRLHDVYGAFFGYPPSVGSRAA